MKDRRGLVLVDSARYLAALGREPAKLRRSGERRSGARGGRRLYDHVPEPTPDRAVRVARRLLAALAVSYVLGPALLFLLARLL